MTSEEPVPVDHILRPHGRDKAVSIGRFLQAPRKLDEQHFREKGGMTGVAEFLARSG
jgi:hypothetical protein